VIVIGLLLVGCGGSTKTSTSSASAATVTTLGGAAQAYAQAFLDGNATAYKALQSPSCPGTAADYSTEFNQLRPSIEHVANKKISAIKVTGAHTRNETATSGEAEATFDLDPQIAGTDNYLAYAKQGDSWIVIDCNRLPIGGSSSGGSSSASG
jgi:hypothetical protein